ncbi:MAG: hypothetical protein GY749_28000 [Desulfobacteraceae bacterium]|nr:hypothetical protein [Desulfobacteraceae bacterium]
MWIITLMVIGASLIPVSWGLLYARNFFDPILIAVLFPLIYFIWLFILFVFSFLEMAMWRFVYEKPSHMYINEDMKSIFNYRLIRHSWMRRELFIGLQLLWQQYSSIYTYCPGEVWGGNPAVLMQSGSKDALFSKTGKKTDSDDYMPVLKKIIADTAASFRKQ